MSNRILITWLAFLFFLLGGQSGAYATPQSIHYQGYLTDDLGEPVNDTVEMEFRLYDVEVAGEAFWSTDGPLAVDIESGVFRVTLAPITAAELASDDVWLGITVVPSDPGEPSQEMSPRLKVLSVPFALVAEHATSADFAGEAAAVTDIDFTTFATGEDVEGVLGVCIQEADLTEALAGYCEAPCYGDSDVEGLLVDGGYVTDVYLNDNSYLTTTELDAALSGVCQAPCYGDSNVEWLLNEGAYVTELFLTENGYVTQDSLAQWAEENVTFDGITEDELIAHLADGGYMTEEDLGSFLAAGGYLTEEELLWFLAEAGYPDADQVVLRDGSASLEGDWDVGGNQLLNLVVHSAASDSAPESPNAGQLWWDTTEKLVKVYDGAEWKVVGGGDVAFASDSDTLDGMDSTDFELAGAVAAHEAANPHLSDVQFAALTGGPESVADAHHTHDISGGLPNVNPDLLNSVFTKKYCSTDTPMTAPTDFGQVVSTIQVGDAGAIISAQIEIDVTHAAPDTLVPTLTGPGEAVDLSQAFQLDGTGDWTFDVTQQFKDLESSGNWGLEILDMTSSDGVVTLENWCLTIEYMSSDKLEIVGGLDVDASPVSTSAKPGPWIEFVLYNMLSSVDGGTVADTQKNLVVMSPFVPSDIKLASSSCKYSSGLGILFANTDLYDDYSDATPDPDYWSFGGSPGNGGGDGHGWGEQANDSFSLSGEGYIFANAWDNDSDGISAVLHATGNAGSMDLSPAGGTDGEVIFYYSLSASGCPQGKNVSVSLKGSDGGSIALHSITSTSSINTSGTMRLVFRSGDAVDVYVDDMETHSTNSTAGLSGEWYLSAGCSIGGGNYCSRGCSVKIGKVRFANGANSVAPLVARTETLNVDESAQSLFSRFFSSNNDDFEYVFSFDGGLHFFDPKENSIHTTEHPGMEHVAEFSANGGLLTSIPFLTSLRYYYGEEDWYQ